MRGFTARTALFTVTVTAIAAAVLMTGSTSSQGQKKKSAVQSNELEVRRSVFSGNEDQLGVHWWVNADCTSQLVDVRVVRQPANGEIAFKETQTVVELRKESVRAHCNGKPVNAIGSYYTSREEFTGQERVVIDVDFRTGSIQRYNFLVSVR